MVALASAKTKRSVPRPRPLRPSDFKRDWTYDELSAELEESHLHLELWDGELIMAPAPLANHQRMVFRLSQALGDFLRGNPSGELFLSPIDMVLSPRRTVQPDLAYISAARSKIVRGQIFGAADLVMEVISPRGRIRDRRDKRDLYEQHGVEEYWIIDPEAKTVEVLSLRDGEYHLAIRARAGDRASSLLLSGFSVDVATLFEGIGDAR